MVQQPSIFEAKNTRYSLEDHTKKFFKSSSQRKLLLGPSGRQVICLVWCVSMKTLGDFLVKRGKIKKTNLEVRYFCILEKNGQARPYPVDTPLHNVKKMKYLFKKIEAV